MTRAVLKLCAFCVAARGLEGGGRGYVRVEEHGHACDRAARCSCASRGECSDCRVYVAERETWRAW